MVLGAIGLLTPLAHLVLVTVVAVLLAVAGRGTGDATAAGPSGRGERVWIGLWGAWLSFLLGFPIAATLGAFPQDFDALWYHLPLVTHWAQAGDLYAPDACFWFYPANGELITFWIVGPFSGDFLAGLTNLPPAVLLAAASVECGAAVGLPRPAAYLTSLAVVTHRVSELQLVGVGNDLWTAALLLAAFWYGLRATVNPGRSLLVFCGACLGLLAGVKYYALGYALLSGGVVLVRIRDMHGGRVAIRAGVVVTLAAVLTGGYWYARNTVATGSPLYPKAVALTGPDVYTEKHPGLWESTFFGNRDPAAVPLVSAAVANYYGPGLWVAFVGGPVIAGWLAASAVRDRTATGGPRAALAVVVAGSAVLLGVTPNAIEDDPGTLNAIRWGYPLSRFALCYVSVSLIGLVLVVHRAFRRVAGPSGRPAGGCRAVVAAVGLPAVLGTLLAIHLWQLAAHREWAEEVLTGASIAVVGAALVLGLRALPWRGRVIAVVGCWAAATWAAAAGVDRLAAEWHRGFAGHYDDAFGTTVYSELAAADPRTIRVGFHGYKVYPFLGSRRQFAVCHPFYAPSASWLAEYLRDRRVTHVVVYRSTAAPGPNGGQYFWWFDQCRAASPGCYRPVGEGSEFSVFFVPPECR